MRLAKERRSLPDNDAAVQKKAANLIDRCSSVADQARPHPVQRLQIQLLGGLGWNKASRWPLHSLGYRMGLSEIILVHLPKRLRIRGRKLPHVVTARGKVARNRV